MSAGVGECRRVSAHAGERRRMAAHAGVGRSLRDVYVLASVRADVYELAYMCWRICVGVIGNLVLSANTTVVTYSSRVGQLTFQQAAFLTHVHIQNVSHSWSA